MAAGIESGTILSTNEYMFLRAAKIVVIYQLGKHDDKKMIILMININAMILG